jgi:hypothetical protein
LSVLRYANFKLRSRLLRGEEPGWLQRHPRRSYIRQCVLATPPWANFAEIKRIDKVAREKTLATGKKHVVDHIIPLTHKRVCGLNLPINLQVIEAGPNAAKSNHWCEWHGELFAEPEQFSLGLRHAQEG